MLLLPLASRLSLMANPVFAQLTRAWGLSVRFVGVDRDGLAYDFRALLTDRTLKLLVELLDVDRSDEPGLLDALFAALGREMLTILERRGAGWERYLDVDHRLEPEVDGTLFARATRYPDFLARLRQALHDEIVDVAFYGRALRSIDLREAAFEQRAGALIESALEPVTMAKLARSNAGRHLGCYNWLRIDPQHAAARAHVLARLPGLATFFAETLVPLEAMRVALRPDDDATDPAAPPDDALAAPPPSTFDLKALAARKGSVHSAHWAAVLRRAIDAGQDRAVIEATAQRFSIPENVIRRLWREAPAAFGQPPTWHLAQILRELQRAGERAWPASDAQWQALIASAVPAEAG